MAVSVLMYYMIVCLSATVCAQKDLASYFKDCRMGDEKFDNCLKNALNEIRPLFKEGLPQYGVDKFDPFFAKTIKFKRGGPNANLNLVLKNVYESGWTNMKITHLKTDFKNNKMVYRQVFPAKFLNGEFDIKGNILGRELNNAGTWNLSLTDYAQTTTITRKPRQDINGTLIYDTPINVDIKYENAKGMNMNFGDLSGQSGAVANMIGQLVNSSWPIGMIFLRSIIDEIVSTAFTDLFTKAFQNFPFHEIIQ
ncbi:hypothetical protein RI129_004627 [Pyrocoelia pectoralis]|uniref:Hemolymph juvenile hormone binding protein n=1 Tax=Pyrocoelia pectoralis TaxID=417401 RepID=A0AAN7ZQL6_9COLE